MSQSLLESASEFLARCRSNNVPITRRDISDLKYLMIKTRWQALFRSFTTANELNQPLKLLQYQGSLLSPARRLPPELLTEIFTFIVKENPMTYGDNHLPVTRLDAFGLSQVCCWWRTLVVSQPILWSFISVNLSGSFSIKGKVFFRKCVIPRSGSTPLSITLEFSDTQPDLEGRDILNDLVTQAYRWKHLRLLILPRCGMRHLENALMARRALTHPRAANTSPLPLLESLTIISIDYMSLAHVKSFVYCPRLKELHITGNSVTSASVTSTSVTIFSTTISNPVTTFTTDFAIITTSFLDTINTQNLIILEIAALGCPIVDLLKACPSLQTLTMGALRSRFWAPLPECFSHIHLTTLNLRCIDDYFPKDVWQSVRLPNLAYLDVVTFRTRAHTDQPFSPVSKLHIKPIFDALMNMLIISGCYLQKVSIQEERIETLLDYAVSRNFLEEVPMSPTGVLFLNQVLWTRDSFTGRLCADMVWADETLGLRKEWPPTSNENTIVEAKKQIRLVATIGLQAIERRRWAETSNLTEYITDQDCERKTAERRHVATQSKNRFRRSLPKMINLSPTKTLYLKRICVYTMKKNDVESYKFLVSLRASSFSLDGGNALRRGNAKRDDSQWRVEGCSRKQVGRRIERHTQKGVEVEYKMNLQKGEGYAGEVAEEQIWTTLGANAGCKKYHSIKPFYGPRALPLRHAAIEYTQKTCEHRLPSAGRRKNTPMTGLLDNENYSSTSSNDMRKFRHIFSVLPPMEKKDDEEQ
ncbi:hypothetical protein BDP27DRAFT_1359643 [Rhodocollybia butyracea]|uniref:F-box domain-containing protein n=1 Tax=Rhodocollybia butyracea TaxID=206335 RepID=A0A9P5Q3N9_9AGAR|nr:hypothetical protein BDP27DRAFT_1359643 [Rhodocollybia butyracea]